MLTKDILKTVRRVEIRTRRLVTDAVAGAYHSVFKGQGMDFEEVREYVPGDDVRSIDWNVTAKMDRPFIKKFREERELTIMLLVDLSGSGAFGSAGRSKRELAAELASVLAFSATKNNDKVGLLLFTDQVEQMIFPSKGRSHILRVIREVLFFEPTSRGTDLTGALDTLNKVLRRRAVCFLISDFITGGDPGDDPGPPPALAKAIALTNRRHDLIGIDLSDPREAEVPDVGLVTLEDAETGQQVVVDTSSRAFREGYAAHNRARRDGLRRAFRQSGVDLLDVSTDQPFIHALQTLFERRGKRR